MSLVEREPLARLARKPLAVDRDGYVFVRYLGIETLPCISGYPPNSDVLGTQVTGMTWAALELFELLKNHTLPLQIVDVDVSREDYLDCTMSDQRRVKLAWPRMGENDARSNRLLLAQLPATWHYQRVTWFVLVAATLDHAVYLRLTRPVRARSAADAA